METQTRNCPSKGHRVLSPILHDGMGNHTSNNDSAIDSFCIKGRLHYNGMISKHPNCVIHED